MLLFICVILGVAAGLLNKGKFSGIVELKGLYMPIAALVASSIPAYYSGIAYAPKAVLITFSYFCVLAFALLNRRYFLASVLSGLGALSNFLVIASNSFRMPISEYALVYYPDITAEKVVASHSDYFIAVNGDANMLILGDVICVPIPYFGGFISVGDVFLAVGMFVLIFAAMASAKEREPKKLTFYWAPHHH